MKLKTKVFVSAFILTSLSVFAETKLVITGTDGKDINVQIQKISEITFSEAGMTIVSTEGNQTIPLADIAELTFDATQNGATNAVAELDDIKVTLTNSLMTATTQGQLEMTVYNIQGQPVASVTGNSEVTLDLRSMAKGVYIVKVNNKIIKVIR